LKNLKKNRKNEINKKRALREDNGCLSSPERWRLIPSDLFASTKTPTSHDWDEHWSSSATAARPIRDGGRVRFNSRTPLADRAASPNSPAVRSDKYVTSLRSSQPSTVAKRLARHFTFGRSRVLTPVPPDQVWVFFRGFPTPSHRGMSHITDKANAGSVSTSQYLPPSFRTHPHRTHPESSRQCG
jgi:hypothetical protein